MANDVGWRDSVLQAAYDADLVSPSLSSAARVYADLYAAAWLAEAEYALQIAAGVALIQHIDAAVGYKGSASPELHVCGALWDHRIIRQPGPVARLGQCVSYPPKPVAY